MNLSAIACIFVIINGVICCSNPIQNVPKCQDGSPVFDRAPLAENNYTTKWCIGVMIFTDNFRDRGSACYSSANELSAPENQMEMDFILQEINKTILEKGLVLENWTIATDVHRDNNCDDTCTPNEAYYHQSLPGDATYAATHWIPGQPDTSIPDGRLKSCLGFNKDGQFRNIYCNYRDALHINGTQGYNLNGHFCAYPAK